MLGNMLLFSGKKEELNREDLFTILIVAAGFCVFAAITYRMFFGVATTDEMFGISEAALLENGATPYVDNWTQTAGFSIFAAPILFLFHFLKGNYEGILIFCRIIKVLLTLGVSFLITVNMKKNGLHRNYSLLGGIVFALSGTIISPFHYTHIAIAFIVLGWIYCIWIFKEIDTRYKYLYVIGSFYALSIYSHPTEIVPAIILLLPIILFSGIYRRKSVSMYILGGVSTAVIFTVWMIIRGGGFSRFIYGMDTIFIHNGYYRLGHASIGRHFKELFLFEKSLIIILLVFVCVVLLLKKWNLQWIGECGYLIISLGYTFLNMSRSSWPIHIGFIVTAFILWRTWYFLRIEYLRKCYFFLFLPLFGSTLTLGFLGINYLQDRMPMMRGLWLLIIAYIYYMWMPRIKIKVFSLIAILAFFATIQMIDRFADSKDDASLRQCTYHIDTGIFKGIYSGEDVAKRLLAQERYLNNLLKSTDKVLYMECVEYAYLMTNAIPFAPSTFDESMYSYGFNDDTIYQRYFKTMEGFPDYIIYIDTGRDPVLSIDVPNYHFTKFVKDNYDMMDRQSIYGKDIVVYKRQIVS